MKKLIIPEGLLENLFSDWKISDEQIDSILDTIEELYE